MVMNVGGRVCVNLPLYTAADADTLVTLPRTQQQ